MTIFLDSTALFSRFTDGSDGDVVRNTMSGDPTWCVSAVALTECQMLLQRLDPDPITNRRMRRAINSYWETFHVVPVDSECLDRAAEIGRGQPLRTIDAIQLAAADRLPRPVVFVTFDPNQIGPALALGFDIASPLTATGGSN